MPLTVEQALAALPDPFQEPCNYCDIPGPHVTYELDAPQGARGDLHHRWPSPDTRTLIHTFTPTYLGADDDRTAVEAAIRNARLLTTAERDSMAWRLDHRLIVVLHSAPARARLIETRKGAFEAGVEGGHTS